MRLAPSPPPRAAEPSSADLDLGMAVLSGRLQPKVTQSADQSKPTEDSSGDSDFDRTPIRPSRRRRLRLRSDHPSMAHRTVRNSPSSSVATPILSLTPRGAVVKRVVTEGNHSELSDSSGDSDSAAAALAASPVRTNADNSVIAIDDDEQSTTKDAVSSIPRSIFPTGSIFEKSARASKTVSVHDDEAASSATKEVTPGEFTLDGPHATAVAPRKPSAACASGNRAWSGASSTRKRARQVSRLLEADSDDSIAQLKQERVGPSKRVSLHTPPDCRVTRSTVRKRLVDDGFSSSDHNESEVVVLSPGHVASDMKGMKIASPKRSSGRSSVRKRRRIVETSSEDEESGNPDDEIQPAQKPSLSVPSGIQGINRSLSTGAPRRGMPNPPSESDEEPDKVVNVSDDSESEKSSLEKGSDRDDADVEPRTPPTENVMMTRSARRRMRAGKLSFTPPSTPSPPSTKKRRRLARLQLNSSDSEDEVHTVGKPCSHAVQKGGSKSGNSDVKSGRKNRPGSDVVQTNADDKKGEWFFERDIANFSSSDEGQPIVKRKRGTPAVRVSPSEPVDDIIEVTKEGSESKGDLLKDFSDEVKDAVEVVAVDDSPEKSAIQPRNLTPKARKKTTVSDDVEILDLMDEDDDFEEPLSSRRVGLNRPNNEDSVEVTDDDDKPPPFNLHAMCNENECMQDMIERIGEAQILEQVSNAQKAGREIIGGEELGLSNTFSKDVFSRYSKTVVAAQINKDRTAGSVAEESLRGDYNIDYGGASRFRGRGRGRGFRGRFHGGFRGSRGGRRGWGRGSQSKSGRKRGVK